MCSMFCWKICLQWQYGLPRLSKWYLQPAGFDQVYALSIWIQVCSTIFLPSLFKLSFLHVWYISTSVAGLDLYFKFSAGLRANINMGISIEVYVLRQQTKQTSHFYSLSSSKGMVLFYRVPKMGWDRRGHIRHPFDSRDHFALMLQTTSLA